MKNVFIGLTLMLSFSAFADSKLEDSAPFSKCGGGVELRSSVGNEGETRFALQFIGIKKCSNVRLSSGEDYKLTNKSGVFAESKNFNLSNKAAAEARSAAGLAILIESGTGKTSEQIIVHVTAPVKAPVEAPAATPEYEPTTW